VTVTRWTMLTGALGMLSASVLLAGCGGAPIPTSPSESAAPASAASASSAPASPASAPTTVATTPELAGGACRTSQLAVARVDQGGSGMMKSDNSLRFTNVSSTSCTLHGFPTVTAVGDNGLTLTQPAATDGHVTSPVTLPPRGTAVAPMLITQTAAYDPGQCTPVPAKGLRIYPPGQNIALFLAEDLTVCAQGGPNTLHVASIAK
jgi:Domain of unknown function (DUF4232)